jgi:hypothetical protein
MQKSVSVDLVHGIKTFRKRVHPEELRSAWETRNYSNVMKTIPWQYFPQDIEKMIGGLHKSVQGGGQTTIEMLPAPIQKSLRWDMKNPVIKNYLNEVTGRLVVNIQEETMKNIQQAVMRSYTNAAGTRDIASEIKGSIGLHPRYEAAVRNYENGLADSGLAPDEIQDKVEAYSDRLLDSRAQTIAKTEVRQASNYGQLTVWQAGQQQGLIKKEAQKIWVTCRECICKTPCPCEICEPMDGEPADIHGFWKLDDGTVCEVPSDAHPNCNCGMTIDIGVEGGEEDEEDEE